MKNILLLSLLAVSAWLAGCADKSAKPAGGDAPADDGIDFKLKGGLSVPDAIARHIGLKLEDVAERKVHGKLTFTAQVYGEAGPQARRVILASAWLALPIAQSIAGGTDIVATTADTNSFAGVVARVVPAADTNASAEVLLELHAESGELRVGDFAQVTITTPGKEDVVVIPRAALLHTTEGTFVYAVNGTRLTRTAVKLGGEQDGVIEVRDGLLAGDRIAVSGVPLLWLAELQKLRGGKSCCDVH